MGDIHQSLSGVICMASGIQQLTSEGNPITYAEIGNLKKKQKPITYVYEDVHPLKMMTAARYPRPPSSTGAQARLRMVLI